MPAKKEQHRMGARIRSNMPDWHLCIVRQDYSLASALCERLRHGSIAPFISLPIEVTT
jgi:hypothetical protein